mmetsp:Transcript_6290/g.17600  ORF Transcript_6290/g.17600 Transcript_6290/m.17600 type:complete len:106 (-) Transcript_6290:418-735(-)
MAPDPPSRRRGSGRRALELEPGHADALRNILVCLEHLVELEELHLLARKVWQADIDPSPVFSPSLRAEQRDRIEREGVMRRGGGRGEGGVREEAQIDLQHRFLCP